MPKKPVVMTYNRLFLVLAVNVQSNKINVLALVYTALSQFSGAAWRISSGTRKKRIARYFGSALLGFMLFGFQNHFPLSGKMILLTKKKITMDTPPFRTVVPML